MKHAASQGLLKGFRLRKQYLIAGHHHGTNGTLPHHDYAKVDPAIQICCNSHEFLDRSVHWYRSTMQHRFRMYRRPAAGKKRGQ